MSDDEVDRRYCRHRSCLVERSLLYWKRSHSNCNRPHSQQQADEGESYSGLQQSKDGLGCF